jgi:hypothetical protein
MAIGSGILAIRAYLIEEWAFFILEVAWFITAMLGFLTRFKTAIDKQSSDVPA